MICFVDLPNLTSIYSEGGSFYEPHSVILESIFKVQLLWYIDIPNLQNVNLPDSFKKVKAKSILSIFWYFHFINRCFFYSRWSC